jgi:hypothetical protein
LTSALCIYLCCLWRQLQFFLKLYFPSRHLDIAVIDKVKLNGINKVLALRINKVKARFDVDNEKAFPSSSIMKARNLLTFEMDEKMRDERENAQARLICQCFHFDRTFGCKNIAKLFTFHSEECKQLWHLPSFRGFCVFWLAI